MTTIALRSEFKKDKVTSDFFVRSHFVNNLSIRVTDAQGCVCVFSSVSSSKVLSSMERYLHKAE